MGGAGGVERRVRREVLGQTAKLQFYLLRSFCALGMAMPFAILDIAPKTQQAKSESKRATKTE